MNPDQDRRESRQFDEPMIAGDLEGYQPVPISRPPTPPDPPSIRVEPEIEDREESDEAVRNAADPVDMKAIFLAALTDKDHDDSSSMRNFSSQEDLLDNDIYGVELAPESPDESPEHQENELAEVATADQEVTVDSAPSDNEGEIATDIEPGDQPDASQQDETIIGYDADNESDGDDVNESDGELNDTVVDAQGVPPSADTDAIEVHPHGELNVAVAATSDEVVEVVEQVPHTNLPPEAIVNEVEEVQVAAPVEPNGACSIMILSGRKDLHLLTRDNGTSLRVMHTNEDNTFIMVMQDNQEVPLTTPFPMDTTFVGKGNDNGND